MFSDCLRPYDLSNNGTGSLPYDTEAYHVIPQNMLQGK